MKYLLVGDPHVTIEELDDSLALGKLILETVRAEEPDVLLFLGDLHHNHSLVRIEVVQFWRSLFTELKKCHHTTQVWALVGNHDMSHDAGIKANALSAYHDLITVVDRPYTILDDLLLLPYYHSNEEFVKVCNYHANYPFVICHQSFNGAKFENGFYDPHGVDQTLIPQKTVIAGHIHARQLVGKVWYPGSPRWRTVSDANEHKYLDLFTISNGQIVDKKHIPTDTHCKKIIQIKATEESGVVIPDIHGPAEIILDLDGSERWCNESVQIWAKSGIRCRTIIRKAEQAAVSESEGIGKALVKYLESYKPKHGTDNAKLKELAAERIHV